MRTTAAPATKHVAKTKQVAENVFDSTKTRARPTRPARGAAGNTSMTKPVVTFALLGVGQHAVSFGCFFELFFGGGVVRVLIRVILHCESPVGALDFLVRSGAADARTS